MAAPESCDYRFFGRAYDRGRRLRGRFRQPCDYAVGRAECFDIDSWRRAAHLLNLGAAIGNNADEYDSDVRRDGAANQFEWNCDPFGVRAIVRNR